MTSLPWCAACDHPADHHDGDTNPPHGTCDCGCDNYTEDQP